ncbi:MAG: ribosome recycling factor [Mycoplasmatales bacterium]|nr:ribosome recycling factor [Mycoplasmatales bacterium]
MEINLYKSEAETEMKKSVHQYEINISKISTGRANPQILSSVSVIYYGVKTPLNEMANISVPDPRQLLLKPFDISVTKDIASSINNSKLGVNAVDEGDRIRISFPELTTERRRELVKSLSSYTEKAKISIRHSRQEINKMIKSDDELNEDDLRYFLEEIQKLTNIYTKKIDELTKEKEKSLMTI